MADGAKRLVVDFDIDKLLLLQEWKRKVLGKGASIKMRVQELIEKDLKGMRGVN